MEFKLPHIGWNEIEIENNSKVFKDVKNKNHMYFVHSYEFIPKDKKCFYNNKLFIKDVMFCISKNIYGNTISPREKSKTGLKIIDNF